ncbi:MAG: RecQ family zinc-binding domain-containing protein, partial [Gemmatimonadota bacterium]|nr:RecQ family zinc-binding domain-containing protein [Gemmatimonadota bacterium]
ASFARPELILSAERKRGNVEKKVVELVTARPNRSGVVYAGSREKTETLAQALRDAGVPALAYHAGLEKWLRAQRLEEFLEADAAVMVATIAFGMGVDKPDVRLVVHDALSPSLEAYYQEAGRAGRDGLPGECVLLYARGDRRFPEHCIAVATPGRRLVEAVARAAARTSRTPPRTAAQATDGAALDVTALARETGAAPALVAGALAVLERAGGVIRDAGDRNAVWVRLLATPARITNECPPDGAERALLRTLWIASRGAIACGATVPVAALPPGLAFVGLPAALDRLQAASLIVWRTPGAGRQLSPGAGDASVFDAIVARVDWAALDARRRVARARLAAMICYAETRGCRRAALLAYFGDSPVGVPCGGCDRCA